MPDTNHRTVARSERGFDETIQGMSLTPRWPIGARAASVEIGVTQP
jgi:hypothetical protein